MGSLEIASQTQKSLPDLRSFIRTYPDSRQPIVNQLQREIAVQAIERRGVKGLKQYGRFFGLMWAYGIAQPEQAALIRSSYFWLRHVDDIADGDKPLPTNYSSKQEYLKSKRKLLATVFSPDGSPIYGDKEDLLVLDYALRAKQLGIDLGQESLAILDTITFDEERSRTRRIPTKAELDDYFYKLDFACIAGALKVAGETWTSDSLADLSWAVRTMFNLRDFPKDFRDGITNISLEDIEAYGIDLKNCEGKETPHDLLQYEPIRKWYADEVAKASAFLARARDQMKDLPMKKLTHLAIHLNFIKPVETTLQRIKEALHALEN